MTDHRMVTNYYTERLEYRMHGHKLHDLEHNEYSNRMVPNIKPYSCSY